MSIKDCKSEKEVEDVLMERQDKKDKDLVDTKMFASPPGGTGIPTPVISTPVLLASMPTMKELEDAGLQQPKLITHINGLLMVKNEIKTVEKTINSCVGFINELFVLDTGSTDGTLKLIKETCTKHNIICHLEEKEFPFPFDFRVARNHHIKWVEEYLTTNNRRYEWLISLDANDELKPQKNTKRKLEYYNGTCIGFYCTRNWLTSRGVENHERITIFKSHKGWYYGATPVHECLLNPNYDINVEREKTNNVVSDFKLMIYQDRTEDDLKSLGRFKNDKIVLLNELIKINTEIATDHKKKITDISQFPYYPRLLFYLGQTCMGLGEKANLEVQVLETKKERSEAENKIISDLKEEAKFQYQDAFNYYKQRSDLNVFREEVYHSFHNMGQLGFLKLGKEWNECLGYFMLAFHSSVRIEPLMFCAGFYFSHFQKTMAIGSLLLADMYMNYTLELNKPDEDMLFIDIHAYEYKRYRVMADINYMFFKYSNDVKRLNKAIKQLEQCIVSGKETEVYNDNLALQEYKKIKDGLSKN